MKIREIKVWKENLKLKRPYTIAFKTINKVENGIIELTTANGLTGYGAFSPVEEVTGETLEDGLALLGGNLQGWLTGQKLESILDLHNLCAKIQQKYPFNPAVRSGLEMALYDLFSQSQGMSLVTLLGQQLYSLPTSVTIGIKGVPDTLAEAAEYTGRGFKILKVKLGHSVDEDIERLVRLKESYGREIRLIVDANQGYNVPELMQFFDQTSELDIELIEQPLSRGREEAMRNLPAGINAIIAADESLISHEDALLLARMPKACGLFNIKLMKCGGILEALKIAGTALKSNIHLMWGCNDESLISITAALHVAFACKNTKYIDLDGSLDLAHDVVSGGFLLKDGMMSISGQSGLGLLKR